MSDHSEAIAVRMSRWDEAHAAAVRMTVREQVQALMANLGVSLTAYIAGCQHRTSVHRWAAEDGNVPGIAFRQKLYAAQVVWLAIESEDGPDVARAWFIGANPRLDEESPASEVHNGRIPQFMAAAHAFVEGE